MFNWQSAWRLLIVTLALATAWPAFAQVGEGTGVDAEGADAAGDAADTPQRRKRRDPSDWGNWRNYRPSAIIGFGVTWDQGDSSLDGVTRWNPAFVPDCILPYGNSSNCVDSAASFDGWYAGGAINVGGRLTLPEFDLPGKPRPFINASVVLQRQDHKALASTGVPESNWLSSQSFLGGIGQDKYLRLEQTIDPRTILFLGLGTEFLLPIDLYDVRINGSVSYFRAKADTGSRYDFVDTPSSPTAGGLLFETQELVTHGIAPGIGLDVDIGENSLLAFGFYTDVFVGIPLSDGSAAATLRNGVEISTGVTDVERVDYVHQRGMNISVLVGIRVSLTND